MIYRQFLLTRRAILWFLGFELAFYLLLDFFVRLPKATYGYVSISYAVYQTTYFAWALATVLGVTLGNTSRSEARVLWVLPQPRQRLALSIVAADLATLMCALVIGTALKVGIDLGMAMFMGSSFSVRFQMEWGTTALGIALIFATYGWSALAGMIGRRIAFAGAASLPVLLLWTTASSSSSAIGEFLSRPLVLNPLAVYGSADIPHHVIISNPAEAALSWLTYGSGMTVLIALGVGTCAAAIIMWQRAEVLPSA